VFAIQVSTRIDILKAKNCSSEFRI